MALRVIGAGLGRTGTLSLKFALERLLGEPCYHMMELFKRPEQIPLWHSAARGEMPDWNELFAGYAAAVDWPASAYWKEISAAFPDALILLSTRSSDSWWASANKTIFPTAKNQTGPWREMIDAMFANRFTADLENKASCIAAFERHNTEVRATAPPQRLLEWQAGDGWAPICTALKLPIPDEPFPHTNTTEEFLARQAPE